MKKHLFIAAVVIAAVVLLSAPAAHASSVAVGPNISTLGVGGEIPVKLNRSFVLRFGANYFEASVNRSLSDIDYEVGFELASAGASLDFHPFRNGLLISGGYFWNGNRLKLKASPKTDVQIGSQTFTPAEVGNLNGELEFDKFVPFVGIGYDSTFYTEGAWSLNFRAGVVFLGQSRVSMSASGTKAGDPTFRAELEQESRSLEDTLDEFGVYPVVTLGVKYRF